MGKWLNFWLVLISLLSVGSISDGEKVSPGHSESSAAAAPSPNKVVVREVGNQADAKQAPAPANNDAVSQSLKKMMEYVPTVDQLTDFLKRTKDEIVILAKRFTAPKAGPAEAAPQAPASISEQKGKELEILSESLKAALGKDGKLDENAEQIENELIEQFLREMDSMAAPAKNTEAGAKHSIAKRSAEKPNAGKSQVEKMADAKGAPVSNAEGNAKSPGKSVEKIAPEKPAVSADASNTAQQKDSLKVAVKDGALAQDVISPLSGTSELKQSNSRKRSFSDMYDQAKEFARSFIGTAEDLAGTPINSIRNALKEAFAKIPGSGYVAGQGEAGKVAETLHRVDSSMTAPAQNLDGKAKPAKETMAGDTGSQPVGVKDGAPAKDAEEETTEVNKPGNKTSFAELYKKGRQLAMEAVQAVKPQVEKIKEIVKPQVQKLKESIKNAMAKKEQGSGPTETTDAAPAETAEQKSKQVQVETKETVEGHNDFKVAPAQQSQPLENAATTEGAKPGEEAVTEVGDKLKKKKRRKNKKNRKNKGNGTEVEGPHSPGEGDQGGNGTTTDATGKKKKKKGRRKGKKKGRKSKGGNGTMVMGGRSMGKDISMSILLGKKTPPGQCPPLAEFVADIAKLYIPGFRDPTSSLTKKIWSTFKACVKHLFWEIINWFKRKFFGLFPFMKRPETIDQKSSSMFGRMKSKIPFFG